jgi:hypothetical protein
LNESLRKRFLEAYRLPPGAEKALRLGQLATDIGSDAEVEIRLVAKAAEIDAAAQIHRHIHVVIAGSELLSILRGQGLADISPGIRLGALASFRAVLGCAIDLVDLPFEHADGLLAAFRDLLEAGGHPLGGYWQRVAQRAFRGRAGRPEADLIWKLQALSRSAEADGVADCQRCTLVDIAEYMEGMGQDRERGEMLLMATGDASHGCNNSRITSSVAYSRFLSGGGHHDHAREHVERAERLVAELGETGTSWIAPQMARLELSIATSDVERISADIAVLAERIKREESTYARWEALFAICRGCRFLARAGRRVPIDRSDIERQARDLARRCDERAGVERYARRLPA